MKLTNLLTLAPLLPSALALALTTAPPYPTTNSSTTNATVTPPTRYYLQTQVTGSGAANAADKNGLYVSAYHTGAGENDATLESSIDVASVGYLNGTNQQFDLNSDFPWGFVMVLYDYYAEWNFVAVNAGYGDSGFFFNESGLQWNEYPGDFGGWLACDWWHDVPQLFWKAGFSHGKFPSTCSEVNLLPVAVTE